MIPPTSATRPACLALLGVLSVSVAGLRAQDAATPFGLEQVRMRAKQLAGEDYHPPDTSDLPDSLAKLDYDAYRDIRFRPSMALWGGDDLPFKVRFFHRGALFRRRVPMHVVEGSQIADLRFEPTQFDYGKNPPENVPADLGYAGFMVTYPLHHPDVQDEVAAFLGASYFRLIGQQQVYGISARGIAIDTAASKAEEFPDFVEYWLEKPLPGATSLTVFALLDGPSLTGAYRFVLRPGAQTVVDVTADLFFRRQVEKLGVAPLTSMFLFGEASGHPFPDYRPEVHDSDGLLIETADDRWLWRPLQNPKGTHRITRLESTDPAGFGLLQRDRAFTSYEDLESHFERRPSLWVTPKGRWGKGAIELVEIPSEAEWNDNIVAAWVPAEPPAKGAELQLDYGIAAFLDDPSRPELARTVATRIRPGKDKDLFVLDFRGTALGDPEEGPPAASIHASAGKIDEPVVMPNDITGGYRCMFELVHDGNDPIDLEVALGRGQRQLTETWTLRWQRP